MRCSNCGADNPGGTKFCGQCGAPLANGIEPNTSEQVTAPDVAPVPAITQQTQGMGTYDSLWVMGGILALIALFCPNRMIGAILVIVGLIMLFISGIGLSKTKQTKSIFIFIFASIVLFFTVVSFAM